MGGFCPFFKGIQKSDKENMSMKEVISKSSECGSLSCKNAWLGMKKEGKEVNIY
jgi:hypothetical protein